MSSVTSPDRVGDTKRKRGRRHDAKRYADRPWRAWYNLPAWRGEGGRRAVQLKRQPLCERHLARGELVYANVANHKVPHRGDWALFIAGELESLCKACHDGMVQREEVRGFSGGVGSDGWPTDGSHPVYRPSPEPRAARDEPTAMHAEQCTTRITISALCRGRIPPGGSKS